MLSARDARRDTDRRRAPPSQRQQYDEYVLQRIESFKDSVSREELMRMAGEAAAEMHAGTEGQFVLTEVLMADMVDEHIKKRLRIKSFTHWKRQYAKVRVAQREPTHWGLDRSCPLVPLIPRLEPADRALVIGRGAEPCAFLLAAHDLELRFWDADLGIVQRVEETLRQECLALRTFACCVSLDMWVPSDGGPYDVIVLDLGVVAALDARTRPRVVAAVQELTAEGGVHVLLPANGLVPEALFSSYADWTREKLPSPVRRSSAPQGAVLSRPVVEELRHARGA